MSRLSIRRCWQPLGLTAVWLAIAAHSPAAAEYPEKPIRLLLPFPAGGAVDLVARLTTAKMAEELGRPTAARAVARACASNRIAVLIPCHRVVRGDGALGGYRWGIARKAALLAREGARPAV